MGTGKPIRELQNDPDYMYGTSTTFAMDGKSLSSFFIARGPAARGSIRFETLSSSTFAAAGPPWPHVLVRGQIFTRFDSAEVKERVNICSLERPDGSQGLGIFVSGIPAASKLKRLMKDIPYRLPRIWCWMPRMLSTSVSG